MKRNSMYDAVCRFAESGKYKGIVTGWAKGYSNVNSVRSNLHAMLKRNNLTHIKVKTIKGELYLINELAKK